MLAKKYAEAVREIASRIERTQMPRIRQAAEAIGKALADGGAFWVHRIGHGGELELYHRAGGLVATEIFSYSFNVSSPVADSVKGRPRPEPIDSDLEQIRLAVRSSEMCEGDVLMVASVSGRTCSTVELALAAADVGVTVIGLTSLEYTERVESDHPSGRRLREVADIVIDNCAPFGDACLDAEGYDHQVLPISGVAQTIIGWMVCGQVIDAMRQMGKPAHVHMSVNRPGASEYNSRIEEQYNELGY